MEKEEVIRLILTVNEAVEYLKTCDVSENRFLIEDMLTALSTIQKFQKGGFEAADRWIKLLENLMDKNSEIESGISEDMLIKFQECAVDILSALSGESQSVILHRQYPEELDFIDSLDLNYINHVIYESGKFKNKPKMSIGIQGYKRVNQTRECVESVLKFAAGIDYELILLDNGSEDNDETFNFFQSVSYARKKVIKVVEPLGRTYGSIYGTQLMFEHSTGDIFVFLGNDVIVTENALQNIVRCFDSEPSIGLVNPMSSNAWMLQNPGLSFSNIDEMFRVAKDFNQYDPRKWQERLYVAFVASAVRRDAVITTGYYDSTAEWGICARMRNAGYKVLLLGDTWVHHNHDYTTKEDSHSAAGDSERAKYIQEQTKKLIANTKMFEGLSFFEDVMVFELDILKFLQPTSSKNPDVLAIDVKSGQGLLDLKNRLREWGIFKSNSVAFTTEVKYYKYLSTTSDRTFCDRIEFMEQSLSGKYDYIICGKEINLYSNPVSVLKQILNRLKSDGQALIKLRNTSDLNMLLAMFGQQASNGDERLVNIGIRDVIDCIKLQGCKKIEVKKICFRYDESVSKYLTNILSRASVNPQESFENIMVHTYLISVQKN